MKLVAMLVVVASLASCQSAGAIQTALTPAETCAASDAVAVALAGGFLNPAAAIAGILAACAGTTIDDIISLLDKLSLPDGGAAPPAVLALRNEALREKGAAK